MTQVLQRIPFYIWDETKETGMTSFARWLVNEYDTAEGFRKGAFIRVLKCLDSDFKITPQELYTRIEALLNSKHTEEYVTCINEVLTYMREH